MTYKVTDGDLTSTLSATLTITVAAVNDAPIAVNDTASTNEDTLVDTDVVTNDTDVDNVNGDLTVVAASIVATNGTASLLADNRTIRFTPDLNENSTNSGPFTVTYKVTDGDLTSTLSATLTITVAAVNDAPIAVDDTASTNEDTLVDTDVVTNDTDVDNVNGDLTVVAASIVATNGTASLLADNRTIRFTPDLNENSTNSGPFTVTYKVTDGDLTSTLSATLTITVAAVNDAPVLGEIGDKSTAEGSALTFTATATDVEGNTLTFSLANGMSCVGVTSCIVPSGASINASTGAFSWTPPDNGTFRFRVVVTDNGSPMLSDFEEITVTVSNVAPTTSNPGFTFDPVSHIAVASFQFADVGTGDTHVGSYFIWTIDGVDQPASPATVNELSGSGTATNSRTLATGCHTISVRGYAVDDDGGVSAPQPIATTVTADAYAASFQAPIKGDERNIAKYGNVVPVKVELRSSCSGATVTGPNLYITIATGDDNLDPTNEEEITATSVSNADTGTQMRINGGGYIYNLTTKGMKIGQEYTIRIRVGASDGPIILRALFQPKK